MGCAVHVRRQQATGTMTACMSQPGKETKLYPSRRYPSHIPKRRQTNCAGLPDFIPRQRAALSPEPGEQVAPPPDPSRPHGHDPGRLARVTEALRERTWQVNYLDKAHLHTLECHPERSDTHRAQSSAVYRTKSRMRRKNNARHEIATRCCLVSRSIDKFDFLITQRVLNSGAPAELGGGERNHGNAFPPSSRRRIMALSFPRIISADITNLH